MIRKNGFVSKDGLPRFRSALVRLQARRGIGANPYNPWLHWFAVLTACSTVFLIGVGASVTSTGSGDAVPDWPLSYGRLNPPMVGGIFYEHGHRLVAGTVALLITLLMIWLWRSESRRWVRRLGLWAFLAVLVQALLGGLRVLVISNETIQEATLRLAGVGHVEPVRVGIGVLHAVLAQIVLCLTFAIALFTSRAWHQSTSEQEEVAALATSAGWGAQERRSLDLRRAYRLGLVIVSALFVQLLLGAVMRHAGAGLIIPDFPTSFGGLIPPFGNLPYNPNAPFPMTYAEYTFKVAVHFAHRSWAYGIAALIVANLVLLSRAGGKGASKPLFYARLNGGLVVLQILLGASILWSHRSQEVTVTFGQAAVSLASGLTQVLSIVHVFTGATLLGCSLLALLWCGAALRSQARVPVSQSEVPV